MSQPDEISDKTNLNTKFEHTELTQHHLTSPSTNLPFGDLLSQPKNKGTIRIFFNNKNGIYKVKTWNPLNQRCETMKAMNIDIIGLAEPNLKWDTRLERSARNLFQKHYKNCNIAVSSNAEPCYSHYQPGGTITCITNNATGHIKKQIVDPTTLGRWLGFQLATSFGHHLNILTVYQSTKSEGIHTNYKQQQAYYYNRGHRNPDPRKLLLKDLSIQIQKWNEIGDTSIVMIDTNDDLFSKSSLLPTFLSSTSMTTLVKNPTLYPATHVRGSKCIDFIFGSIRLLDHIQTSGITAFFETPCENTDHRGIFIDIDQLALFGATLQSLPTPVTRKIVSTSPVLIQKFLKHIEDNNKIPSLFNNINKLSTVITWQPHHHSALEQMDKAFTATLLKSEQQCAPPTEYAWSVQLQHAVQIYNYWQLSLRSQSNNINATGQLKAIADHLPNNAIYQDNMHRHPKKQFKHARRHLINCRLQADELRSKQHDVQQEHLIEQGRMTKAAAIRQRVNREKQRTCWNLFRTLRKGNNSTGGLTHILIPDKDKEPTTYQRIQQKIDLDSMLLQRNITHFNQAQGTPFTTSPCINIVGKTDVLQKC
jgi:hypothetical protein